MNRRQLLVLTATILGTTIAFLDSSIVNLALPHIGRDLHAGFSDLQWIVDGYLLSLSALILLGGSLGDIFGRKKIYVFGIIGFGVASLLCALSPNIGALIAFRVIQGFFGALLTPGALAIINTNFPRELRGQAIGRWTAFGSVATVLAPLAGGSILAVASWRWIFLINIPIAITCLVIGIPSIKESHGGRTRKVDLPGAAAAVLALVGITYGLIEGPHQGWNLITIGALVWGIILEIVFLLIERRSKDPLVELDLFRSRNFTGSNLMTFAMYGALSGFTFALVIYLQTHLNYSSLKAGFSLLPVSIVMFLFAGRIGKLSAKFGPRLFMTAGPIIASLGMLLLYFLKPGQNYLWHVLPGALVFSIGLVLLVAPLTTTVMSSVDEKSSGIASGINNAVSRVAGLIVIALLGVLGTAHVYQFALGLCVVLAFIAGIISYGMIQNEPLTKQ